MKLNKTNNSQSFGMGWSKTAKKVLVQKISSLPVPKREQSIKLVNYIEENSPNHTLFMTKDFVSAIPNKSNLGEDIRLQHSSISLPNPFSFLNKFFKKDFPSVLEDIKDFITKDNKDIIETRKIADGYEKSLKQYVDRSIMEPGVRIIESSVPDYSVRLAKEARKPDGQKTADAFIAALSEVDKRAQSQGVTVLGGTNFQIYGSRHRATSPFSTTVNTSDKKFPTIIKKINSALDKEEKVHKRILKKEDAAWEKDKRSLILFDLRLKLRQKLLGQQKIKPLQNHAIQQPQQEAATEITKQVESALKF